MSLLRIAIVPERYGEVLSPCAFIRLQLLFNSLRVRGKVQTRYLLPGELDNCDADVVVWHRVSLPTDKDLERLTRTQRLRNAVKIYDLDDNLLDITEHEEAAAYASMVSSVRSSLQIADVVWCSTPALADRVAAETTAKTLVAPNALEPRLWHTSDSALQPSARPSCLRMIYMGTRTHDADLRFLLGVLERFADEHRNAIELTLLGITASARMQLPQWCRVLDPDWNFGASYPAFVNWFRTLKGRFDLGLAPLVRSRFNDCKSPIKVLDYAAIGLPTLASAVPAYTHSLRHSVDCFHAENTARAWCDALDTLVVSRRQLQSVKTQASQLVHPEVFDDAAELRLRSLTKGE